MLILLGKSSTRLVLAYSWEIRAYCIDASFDPLTYLILWSIANSVWAFTLNVVISAFIREHLSDLFLDNSAILCKWLGFVKVVEIILVFKLCFVDLFQWRLVIHHISFLGGLIESLLSRNGVRIFKWVLHVLIWYFLIGLLLWYVMPWKILSPFMRWDTWLKMRILLA